MTDPLRPFAQIVRALRQGGAPAAGKTDRQPPSGAVPAGAGAVRPPSESLRSRLTARIANVDASNAIRIRETFVETVLLWELGDQYVRDPAFTAVVTRISSELSNDPDVCERLHRLLLRLRTRQ